ERLAAVRRGHSAEHARFVCALGEAVRANPPGAVVLRDQGLREHALRFDYRAHEQARPLMSDPSKRGLPGRLRPLYRLGSALLDLTCGYGFKPGRTFVLYLITVAVFAVLFNWLGPMHQDKFPATGLNALWFSFIAIHGRGVVSSGVEPGSPVL